MDILVFVEQYSIGDPSLIPQCEDRIVFPNDVFNFPVVFGDDKDRLMVAWTRQQHVGMEHFSCANRVASDFWDAFLLSYWHWYFFSQKERKQPEIQYGAYRGL